MSIAEAARTLPIPIFGFAAALLFLGAISAATTIAAAGLAVIVAFGCWALRRSSDHRFRHTPDDARQWLRAVTGLPGKTLRTAGVLANAAFAAASPGRVLQHRFDHGMENDDADRARRATALLTASLAPDSFVIMLERGKPALLHAIVEQRASDDPEWLL